MSRRSQLQSPYISTPVIASSYIVPNLTFAGKNALFGQGSTIPSDLIVSSITAVSGNFSSISTNTITAQSTICNIGVFNTIKSLSSITVDATDGNLYVIGGINLDGNILTTDVIGSAGELLLNGIPIATTANLSNVADWSLYPSLSGGVNMATHSIFNTGNMQVSSINGAPIAQGSASNWYNYSAQGTVNLNSNQINNVNTLNLNTGGNVAALTAGTGNTLLVNGSNIVPSMGSISTLAGADCFVTASGNLTATTAAVDINASGGTYGSIGLTAGPGTGGIAGGNIAIRANGGTSAGINGTISLLATEGVFDSGTSGGLITIQANSGASLATAPSAVKVSAGGINIYSGFTPSFIDNPGYTYMHSDVGTNIVTGSKTVFPNIPGTTYLYGASGVVLNSDVYTTDVYPYWDGISGSIDDLNIHGRDAVPLLHGAAYVNLDHVSSISGTNINITGVNQINGAVYPPTTGAVTQITQGGGTVSVDTAGVITATSAVGQDVNINARNKFLVSNDALTTLALNADGSVEINNTNSSTDITLTSAANVNINGLTVNYTGYVQTFPTASASLVGQIENVSTINGAAYPPASVPLSPDVNFSTITMGTAGSIIFSDDGGFLTTATIVGRTGAELNISGATAQGVSLLADDGIIRISESGEISALTSLTLTNPYSGFIFRQNGSFDIKQAVATGDGTISADTSGNFLITATGNLPVSVPGAGLFICSSDVYFNGTRVAPPIAVRQATYYKNTAQSLPNGTPLDISFDGSGAWNNYGGYILHTPGATTFTVVQAGLYNLGLNVSVLANGSSWTPYSNHIITVNITRSGIAQQIVISQTASTASAVNYTQSLSSDFYLNATDVIKLTAQLNYTIATPTIQPVANTFDLNTFFTWRALF